MSYTVSSVDLGKISLNETDTVKSVLQNIAIILSTRKGTCPLYRQFGLSQNFVDKPTPLAIPLLYAEIREAIEEYEPRVEVLDIDFTTDAAQPGILVATVEVSILNEQER